MAMAKAAPSTMGTLMATGYMRGGKALKGVEVITLPEMADFWHAFVEGMMQRGKAKPGEKTIIDALEPAARALSEALDRDAGLENAMQAAKSAAHEGMDKTQNMVAQHGRAAYYQEKSRDILDPGAALGSLMIDTFCDTICK